MMYIVLSLGICTIFLFGLNMPDEYEFETATNDQWWKIIFLTPSMAFLFRIVLLLIVGRPKSPYFLLLNNHIEEAKEHIVKIYKGTDPELVLQRMI